MHQGWQQQLLMLHHMLQAYGTAQLPCNSAARWSAKMLAAPCHVLKSRSSLLQLLLPSMLFG
jgi:hypothetical protein